MKLGFGHWLLHEILTHRLDFLILLAVVAISWIVFDLVREYYRKKKGWYDW